MKKHTSLCCRKLRLASTVRIPSFPAPDNDALSPDTEEEALGQNPRWEALRVPWELLMRQLSNSAARVSFLKSLLCAQEAFATKQ